MRKTKRTSPLKAALLTAVASGSMALLGFSPALAALLSVGIPSAGAPFGGTTCADVRGDSLADNTPVTANSCTAALNQQFVFFGTTIYAQGSVKHVDGTGQICLDVENADIINTPTSAGTKVDIFHCNVSTTNGVSDNPNQEWAYLNGEIINIPTCGSGGLTSPTCLCLDAGTMTAGIQLTVETCTGSTSSPPTQSQYWQIK
jgi:hypothetical protein